MDTAASAFGLSLLFGQDKVSPNQGLEQSWKELETELASGYPALFYGKIPYLPVYAAAGVQIQFGCLMPCGQVLVLWPNGHHSCDCALSNADLMSESVAIFQQFFHHVIVSM